MKKDTVVIIPAFNEEKSISLVLQDIPMERVIEVIVVDNNSTDETAKISIANNAQVVFEQKRGYGQACLRGIEKAREYGPKNIVFLDGDYSDFPEELSLLLTELDRGYEFVLGSRMINKDSRMNLLPQARFGNSLATYLTKLLFKTRYSDLGPFRAINFIKLEELNMQDTDFGWTIEMQLKAIFYKLKIKEISVRYRSRIGVSKITGTFKGTIMAGYKIIYTIFKYKFIFSFNSHS